MDRSTTTVTTFVAENFRGSAVYDIRALPVEMAASPETSKRWEAGQNSNWTKTTTPSQDISNTEEVGFSVNSPTSESLLEFGSFANPPTMGMMYQDISTTKEEVGFSVNSPTSKTLLEFSSFANPPTVEMMYQDISPKEEVEVECFGKHLLKKNMIHDINNMKDVEASANTPPHVSTQTIIEYNRKEDAWPSTNPTILVSNMIECGRRPTSTIRKQFSTWTQEEDNILRESVFHYGGRNWRLIAANLPTRTDVQCLHRWQKVLNPVLVKGCWTQEEDDQVVDLVSVLGTKRWAAIARSLPGRNGKQCRERWCNHLDPTINKGPWTLAEDMMLYLAHEEFGNRWVEISKFIPGRTDNGVKNRWNSSVKKRMTILQNHCYMWELQNPPPQEGVEKNLPIEEVVYQPREEVISAEDYPDDENLHTYEVTDCEDAAFDLFDLDNLELFPSHK